PSAAGPAGERPDPDALPLPATPQRARAPPRRRCRARRSAPSRPRRMAIGPRRLRESEAPTSVACSPRTSRVEKDHRRKSRRRELTFDVGVERRHGIGLPEERVRRLVQRRQKDHALLLCDARTGRTRRCFALVLARALPYTGHGPQPPPE